MALVVNTPFQTFENMYIQSISLKQGNQDYITDIELTLKQINFIGTQTAAADKNVLSKYNQWSRAQVENHGNVQGALSDNTSLIKGWTNKMGITSAGSGIRR